MKTNPNFHPLVERTRKSIGAKPYLDKGCIRCGHNGLDIRVSPNSLDRALKIMDTLIRGLEAKGSEVVIIKEDYKSRTYVKVSGETLAIDMYEKINNIKKGQDQYDYIPNGNLVLRIKETPYGARSEWKDGERKKLEACLDSFINGLILVVEKQKANRLKREQEKREWEESERRGEEERRIRQQEQALIDKLEKEAMGWHRSKIIRSYIEAATAAYIQKYGKVESGSEFDKWKTWAGQQADRLDPLVNKSIT
ncbi:MAG: hypothetical protein WC357_01120 [Candidatus Omnitrophota bacterium]|jgi:hypothetical protein